MKKDMRMDSLDLSDLLNEDTEFLPLMSDEDEAKISKEDTPDVLPILPLRNTVLFPGVIIPITIGRDRSVKLIKDAENGNKTIGVVAQKDFDTELPELSDLHEVGTIAHILKMLKMPDGNITAVIFPSGIFNILRICAIVPTSCKSLNSGSSVAKSF